MNDAATNTAAPAPAPGSTPAAQRLAPVKAWWAGLSARDRRLAVVGGLVLGLYLLWLIALQPAFGTIRRAPAELDALDVQLQQMQILATEATELRAMPPVNPEQAAAALRSASERLGEQLRLQIQGDRAIVTLNGVHTGPLRDWLTEARSGARVRPVEANLARGAQGFTGTLVLSLGGAP